MKQLFDFNRNVFFKSVRGPHIKTFVIQTISISIYRHVSDFFQGWKKQTECSGAQVEWFSSLPEVTRFVGQINHTDEGGQMKQAVL